MISLDFQVVQMTLREFIRRDAVRQPVNIHEKRHLYFPSVTAQTRTASPTPFSDCSPRSSNVTPADVRASERTVSDTSTSPGADSPLMRAAMLTAPP
jgi:hypothetical protein